MLGKTLKKINIISGKIEHSLIALGLITMSVIIFINVISRHFFDTSVMWAEETSRYINVWITFIGLSACLRFNEHIKIDILLNKISKSVKFFVNRLVLLIGLVSSIYLVYLGWAITEKLLKSGNVSVTTGIPIWLLYLAVPVGFILMTISYIQKLYQTFK
ncbi:TRAP transporter small permease [Salirhabdus salicampi]|uniref:TRAP transporter small permease n=1 Tax=Salirhabdus salicampi TaxID=476102 RepID=UPI0020C20054|nr:TRAP transporter small permease [Salirhabdus salicampi]MCP8615263.1 TRAP transporter small permease [Salirhabdus salicampi]